MPMIKCALHCLPRPLWGFLRAVQHGRPILAELVLSDEGEHYQHH